MSKFSKVCVIGMGYIGLPTAAVFADNGVPVIGVDRNEAVVDGINDGKPHIVEPDLDELLQKVVRARGLRASRTPEAADAFIIAVPTPFTSDRQPDLSYIRAAAQAIAPRLSKGNLVVLESTSPVGATEQLSTWLANYRPDLTFPHQAGDHADICVAHCPERVLPGRILREVVENDRVIGGVATCCAEAAKSLYSLIVRGDIHLTTARTAEMAKLTENAFRDVNIAFANELSIICEAQKIDVWELIRLANLHPRVEILNPGPGVGGHCIAVDPWFIVALNPDEARLIRVAREVNDSKPHFVVDKIVAAARAFNRPVIACLGLSYKANVDDLRESPAVEIVKQLARRDIGQILAVEPYVKALPSFLADEKIVLSQLAMALERANIVVLLVDHSAFLNIEFVKLQDKVLIDTRGVW